MTDETELEGKVLSLEADGKNIDFILSIDDEVEEFSFPGEGKVHPLALLPLQERLIGKRVKYSYSTWKTGPHGSHHGYYLTHEKHELSELVNGEYKTLCTHVEHY